MYEEDFEGTMVLEKLAEIGKVDDFLGAVDADDLVNARRLMQQAKIDADTIESVLNKISGDDADSDSDNDPTD